MRWFLLLVASCIFYMAFIPKYIIVLAATITIDYLAGLVIEKEKGVKRKIALFISIISTITVLFIFKYYNFFDSNFLTIAQFFHFNYSLKTLKIILPVGLSFHTFQSLSYVIEVYRKKQKVEHNFGIYSLYVMFYPQLVAGPIERPQNMLHQFYEKHFFEYDRVVGGLKLMLLGMFKKIVIADRLAVVVNQIYNNPHNYYGVPLIVATVLFAYQIYCDFSGYSDIAIGAAQVMGFSFKDNFNRPYYSHSVSEFWKRWHISLSTWFRDYLYIPLGGNRVPRWRYYINIIITFLVSGFWHGANWTFVIWGLIHGMYVLIYSLTYKTYQRVTNFIKQRWIRKVLIIGEIVFTFLLVCFAWIFFRASNLSDAIYISSNLFKGFGPLAISLIHGNATVVYGYIIQRGLGFSTWKEAILLILPVVMLEFIHLIQKHEGIRNMFCDKPLLVRWSLYYILLIWILFFGVFNQTRFIYFQF